METTATPATGIPATGTQGRFVWHELMTSDPKAAEAFYKEVVGWGTIPSENLGMEYTMWTAGETPIGGLMAITPDAKAMGAPPSWTAYIEVPDIDATVAQVEKLGGSVVVPAMSVDQVGRFAILRDPQGAVFAAITSANPLEAETDPQPMTFSWHELATTDLPAAISFYEQIFGWKKQSEFDMGDMGIYYMFGRDRFTYGGMMKKPAESPVSAWLHYVSVDSADAATERATKAGGKVMMGPMEVPGGDRIAALNDPQGAWFAVHSKPAK
jgi:predicted enzyme related to lactoylglutathione lyase